MDRVYHLGVSPENEEKLRRCGEELDRRMRTIRKSGQVLGYDQIAVMVALDLIWNGFDKDAALKESREREADSSANLASLEGLCQNASGRIEEIRAKCEKALGGGAAGVGPAAPTQEDVPGPVSEPALPGQAGIPEEPLSVRQNAIE